MPCPYMGEVWERQERDGGLSGYAMLTRPTGYCAITVILFLRESLAMSRPFRAEGFYFCACAPGLRPVGLSLGWYVKPLQGTLREWLYRLTDRVYGIGLRAGRAGVLDRPGTAAGIYGLSRQNRMRSPG